MKKLILFAFIVSSFSATVVQAQKKVEMICKTIDGKQTATYKVQNFNYNISPSLKDPQTKEEIMPTVSIYMTLKNIPNKFLLQWVSGLNTEMNGEIISTNLATGKVERTISFKSAMILSLTDNISTAGSGYGEDEGCGLTIMPKKLIIDGVEMKFDSTK